MNAEKIRRYIEDLYQHRIPLSREMYEALVC